MKIIEFEGGQGSPSWKLWRQSKITATSASIIMGNNPWLTPLDLYNEMVGITPPQESNAAMTRGSELEPITRDLFIKDTGLEMIPICCESLEYLWMACSLDGFNQENNAILEIKSPNEKTHVMACEGHIPMYYRDQCQYQLACTGASIVYYYSYRPEYPIQSAMVEIKPHPEYIDHMINKCRQFYEDHLAPWLIFGHKNPPKVETLNLRK